MFLFFWACPLEEDSIFLKVCLAYDSVDRDILWSTMRKTGVAGKFLKTVQKMYEGDYITTKLNGVTCRPVYLGRGLRQGCSLSPALFSIYVREMSKDLSRSGLGVQMLRMNFSCIFFADDIALLSSTVEGLRSLLSMAQSHCDALRMTISVPKSKVMSSNRDTWEVFREDEVVGCFEKVLSFKYLGVQLQLAPVRADQAMRDRALELARRYKAAVLRVFRDGPDVIDVAMATWRNIALPSILFGCEAVVFTETCLQELERIQSQVAKSILGLPLSAPNVSAQAMLGLKPMRQLIYSAQLKFFLRTSKLPDSRWSKMAMMALLQTRKSTPYTAYMARIRMEMGMARSPVSNKHVDIVLDHHFLARTNQAIRAFNLPGLGQLDELRRRRHVCENKNSEVSDPLSFLSPFLQVFDDGTLCDHCRYFSFSL